LTLGVPITNQDQPDIYANLFSSKDPAAKNWAKALDAQQKAYLQAIAQNPDQGIQNQQAIQADQAAQAAAQAQPQAQVLPSTGANAGRGGQGGPTADQLGLGALPAAGAQVAPGGAQVAPGGAQVAPAGAQRQVAPVQPAAQGNNLGSLPDNPYVPQLQGLIAANQNVAIPTVQGMISDKAEFNKAYGVDPVKSFTDAKAELDRIDQARQAAVDAHQKVNEAQGLENLWHYLMSVRGATIGQGLANAGRSTQDVVNQQRANDEAFNQRDLLNREGIATSREHLNEAQAALAAGDFKGYMDAVNKAHDTNATINHANIQGVDAMARTFDKTRELYQAAQIHSRDLQERYAAQAAQHADNLAARAQQKDLDREAAYSRLAMTQANAAAAREMANPMNYARYKDRTQEDVAAEMFPHFKALLTGQVDTTTPSSSANISPEAFNAKWATLKSGQTLVGPDGKTYVKQ
jgi:hypothetical protein